MYKRSNKSISEILTPLADTTAADAVSPSPSRQNDGRALSISGISIAIEIFQIAFIIITALILAKERTIHPSQRQELR
jgi:hypothetical protein